MKRKILLSSSLACFIMAAFLIGVRIWHVNDTAWTLPEERYGIGERVSFDGAFAGYDYEETDGYALTVTNAEVMTPREFVQAYGVDPNASLDDISRPDEESLVVLTLYMENAGNEEGYMSSINWRLVSPDDPSAEYYCARNVWFFAHPVMESQPCFEIRPDSEFVVYVPFCKTAQQGYLEVYDDQLKARVDECNFEFIFTNVPVRKMVEFSVCS